MARIFLDDWIDLMKNQEARRESENREARRECEGPDRRPIAVVAGTYREYLRFVRAADLRDHVDVHFVSRHVALHGLPIGDPVILVGSYSARPEWGEIKAILDQIRATCEYADPDSSEG
jgi:hypothetical protein